MDTVITRVFVLMVCLAGSVYAAPTDLSIRRLFKKKIRESKLGCDFDGSYYPQNSSFISKDCQMQCYCVGDGVVSCMELCTPIAGGMCPPGMKIKSRRQSSDSGPSNCFCPDCTPAFCYTAKDEKYKIGESYGGVNCTERCTCTEEGRFHCASACPSLKCPHGYRLKNLGIFLAASGCDCPLQICVKKRKRVCRVNGRTYRTGRPFVTDNCQSECRCKRGGVAKCSPVCRTSTPRCKPNERLTTQHMPVPLSKGRCMCAKKICVAATVNINARSPPLIPVQGGCQSPNGTILYAGQRYISSNCERCRCTLSGLRICTPLCRTKNRNIVRCSHNEEKVELSRKIRGSHCSCSKTVCRRKQKPKVMCSIDGRRIETGATFIDNKNCTKCHCTAHGALRCKPLCSSHRPVTSLCRHGYKITRQVPVPTATQCSCTINECIPFGENKVLNAIIKEKV